MTLSVTAGSESGFEADDDVLFVALEFEDPFGFDRDRFGRHFGPLDDFPSLSLFE